MLRMINSRYTVAIHCVVVKQRSEWLQCSDSDDDMPLVVKSLPNTNRHLNVSPAVDSATEDNVTEDEDGEPVVHHRNRGRRIVQDDSDEE